MGNEMKLTEIAEKIDAHLKRFEADPAINVRPSPKPTKRFWGASSWAAGRYVAVRYVSYQATTNLTKSEALAYLAALDAGSTQRHFEALHNATA